MHSVLAAMGSSAKRRERYACGSMLLACARGGASGRLTAQPIPSSDHKRPYCVLHSVSVERDLRMFEKRQKLAPSAQHVEHGFTQRALWQAGVGHLIEPDLQLTHDRGGLRLPRTERFFGRATLDLPLDAIQLATASAQPRRAKGPRSHTPTAIRIELSGAASAQDNKRCRSRSSRRPSFSRPNPFRTVRRR